jgi:hypothetical protein
MVSSTAAPWCGATVESRTGTPGTGVITVPVLATWKTETTPIWVGGEPMSSLILKRAKVSRPSGQWRDDDYDVICKGAVVGRVFLSPAVPQDRRWMWTLAHGCHEDRTPTHGYEPTREAAMAAFAENWPG